jgi:hypothetical protein
MLRAAKAQTLVNRNGNIPDRTRRDATSSNKHKGLQSGLPPVGQMVGQNSIESHLQQALHHLAMAGENSLAMQVQLRIIELQEAAATENT